VAITPCKLQCISPNWRNILKDDEERDIVGLKPALAGPFIDAGRARTMLAEIADRIDSLVPVAPFNAQHPFVEPGHIPGLKDRLSHVHRPHAPHAIPFYSLSWGNQKIDRRQSLSCDDGHIPLDRVFQFGPYSPVGFQTCDHGWCKSYRLLQK